MGKSFPVMHIHIVWEQPKMQRCSCSVCAKPFCMDDSIPANNLPCYSISKSDSFFDRLGVFSLIAN